jgi:hypothetical protein
MAGQLDNGLSLEAAAMSAWYAWAWAKGIAQPDLERADDEELARFGRLANKSENLLGSLEGLPVSDVSQKVYECWDMGRRSYDTLSDKEKIAWEAVTRHLATLIDADEIPDLRSLERSWAKWAEKRLKRTVTQ